MSGEKAGYLNMQGFVRMALLYFASFQSGIVFVAI